MIRVPAGEILFRAEHRSREGGFILLDEGPSRVSIHEFLIDRYEVTNADYKRFLDASGYQPRIRHNFLRHWRDGYPAHLANHPVTWVDQDDARAFAAWAGKRLPTSIEWQWAAQGLDGRAYPWGNGFDPHACNGDSRGTTPVDAYPLNSSPFGVCDMVGNVWEWTDIELTEGWHRWTLLCGGSYYQARGSSWYTEGGAQLVTHRHKFLLMSPAMDRCATIGFRCAYSKGPTVLEYWQMASISEFAKR
jgi:formylglycine-generating enzyme required for sulfatase activity